jgi:ribosomal protein S18 acetylase RimI-like enzyme
MTTIRRMRVDEAPLLRRLTKEGIARAAAAHPEDRIGISEAGLDNLETHYRLGAVHPDLFTLVAEADGAIVGFVDAEIVRARSLPGVSGEIGDLYLDEGVTPDIAEALAREAVKLLRERGARVILHTEDARRSEREPWESLGFEADVVRFSLYDD